MTETRPAGDPLGRFRQQLHNGLGQSLSLAVVRLDQLSVVDAASLRTVRQLLRDSLQELRQVLRGLNADPTCEDTDLALRLVDCVRQIGAQQAIPLSCTIEGGPALLSAPVCEALLSAARELLLNACKHAVAGEVEVCLCSLPGRLSITVTERLGDAGGRTALPDRGMGVGTGHGLQLVRLGLRGIGARLRWRLASGVVQARISWVRQ